MGKLTPFGNREVSSGKDKGKARFLNFALPKLATTPWPTVTVTEKDEAGNDVTKNVDAPKNEKGVPLAAVSPADIMIPQYDATPEGLQEIIDEISDSAKSAKLLVESVNAAIINDARSAANAAAVGFTAGTVAEAQAAVIAAASAVTLASLLVERTRGGVSGNIKQAKENASEMQQKLAAVNGDMSKLSAEDMAKVFETIILLAKG